MNGEKGNIGVEGLPAQRGNSPVGAAQQGNSPVGVFAPAPPDVRRLAEIIGLPATLALIERYGGTRLYVPQEPTGTELETVIGPEPARALASRYGRDRLIPPVARRWRVLTYRERGQSYREIALATGCTENNVHRILADAGRTVRQLDLFGT